MIGAKFELANRWAVSIQQPAPVSAHHERAIRDILPWLDGLGIRSALEVGAGEPPYLTARLLKERGIECETLDAQATCDTPGDAHDLPLPAGHVDLVVARHVLEHVLCPYLALLEMGRVSRRYLLIVVPVDSPKSRDWPDHLWHIGMDGWLTIFRRLGLACIKSGQGDHTEQYAIDQQLWRDYEWRFLLEKGASSE